MNLRAEKEPLMMRHARSSSPLAHETPRVCPACGARARRERARYCATCGRALDADNDYCPSDALRASYHQHQSFSINSHVGINSVRGHHQLPRAAHTSFVPVRIDALHVSAATRLALAFATYALVPYLGILFCPGAILIGGIGFMQASRTAHHGNRRVALLTVSAGALILCAQILLWWMICQAPPWAGAF